MKKRYFLPTLPSLLSMPGQPFIHRDLSWLQFNERVLKEARTSATPLTERVKFLAISAANLDEFFMIRFASLGRAIGTALRTKSGGSQRKPTSGVSKRRMMQIRETIVETVVEFIAKQQETLDILTAELAAWNVHIVRSSKPGEPAFEMGRRIFESRILAHLDPPTPFSVTALRKLRNLQIGVIFDQSDWIQIPREIPLVYTERSEVDGASYVFLLDDLLRTHLGATIGRSAPPGIVRLTRDGDFTLAIEDEDPESIPDIVRSSVSTREVGRPVRVEYTGEVPADLLATISSGLRLSPGQIFLEQNTVCLRGLWTILSEISVPENGDLRFALPPIIPQVPEAFRSTERIFETVKQRDLLFHQPYDSFDAFVNWIKAACADPDVTMIQQTVYRMDAFSEVIEALKAAAKTKRVRVLIELRARFDELNNLRLAEELRQAGVEVAFGFGKLKLHAKIALVTRMEEGGERYYTHVSTGNYNATTARVYEDLAILTSNPEFGTDAKLFFDSVCSGQIPTGFRVLLSAPQQMHRRITGLIRKETEAARAGRAARIVAKVNALVDQALISELYAASQAGVRIDLLVRGACSLIPGVTGLSENIRVISVVDRFLEHSRIYYFADSNEMYLSSADWMPRNFFSRLELAYPVLDTNLRRYIEEIVLPTYFSDTVSAKELTPQGTWRKRAHSVRSQSKAVRAILQEWNEKQVRAQFFFARLASTGRKGTPLDETIWRRTICD